MKLNYFFIFDQKVCGHRQLFPVESIRILTLKAPFTKIVTCAAIIDQDQAAQNVQPDL